MSADDFKSRDRVSLVGEARFGTVVANYLKRDEYPGFVPVHWDNGDTTMTTADCLMSLDSRSANPQAGPGQIAGAPTPQGASAPTEGSLDRIEGLLIDIKALLTAQAESRTVRIVQKGDAIGYAGSTGNSSGDHVHFESGRRL